MNKRTRISERVADVDRVRREEKEENGGGVAGSGFGERSKIESERVDVSVEACNRRHCKG